MDNVKEFKKMTNEEFIVHCMNYSKYGAMSQIVLMEIIPRGINSILSQKEKWLEEDKASKGNSLFNIEIFLKAVEEWEKRFDMKYGINEEV